MVLFASFCFSWVFLSSFLFPLSSFLFRDTDLNGIEYKRGTERSCTSAESEPEEIYGGKRSLDNRKGEEKKIFLSSVTDSQTFM